MSSLTRRDVLRSGAVAASIGIAGCSAFGGSSSETPELGSLSVTNLDPQVYTVHVLLLDDDGPVYWASERTSAATEESSGEAVFEGYPSGPENYVLQARLEGDPPSAWRTFDFGQFDASCIGIMLEIGEPHRNTGNLSIWKTLNPTECGEDVDGSDP